MSISVAVISQPGPELHAIRSQLRNPLRFLVREFLSIEDINQGLTNYPFAVLIARLANFDSPHVNMLLRIRERFPKTGIVTVCPDISPSARYQVKDIPHLKLLNEPIEVTDLPLVIEKLARGEPSSPRQHPRVRRDGECELFDAETGLRLRAKFLDFGQMGARIQVNPRVPLKRKARYQLHYRSTSEPNRIHRIESSVVWGEVNSGIVGTIVHGPQQIVGVRFIAAL